MSKLTIGGATLNQTPLDWEGNLSNILEAIDSGRSLGITLLNFPELCITGYGCEDMFLSEWVGERALEYVGKIIPKTKSIAVVIGLPLRFSGKTYNTSFTIENKKLLGVYCKRHLAREGVHYEPRWFDSWEEGVVDEFNYQGMKCPIGDITIEFQGIKVGFEICEDAWREDRPANKFIDNPVDLILSPSASHFAFGKADFRENLVVSSSKKYDAYYLYTNLLGNESGRMIFDGDIIIAGKGRLIQRNNRLSYQKFNLIAASIDFESGAIQVGELNERVDSQNSEFTAAASLALFDYMHKSKSKGFVLSLSGGADSSTCAVLVAEMVKRAVNELGIQPFLERIGLPTKNNQFDIKDIVSLVLHTAYQSTKNSSEGTLNSARELAESIGAKFYQWSIDEEVSSYTRKIEQALNEKLTWKAHDIALQNIQARARSPIIWMIANLKNCLLLATSNRSEGDVGYATMDGDTSGSLSPIAAIDKPFILQWLKWAEKDLGYDGLKKVNSLQPTAELRPSGQSQTDEADLMPYPVLLEIEKLAIRDKKSPTVIYKTLNKHLSVPGETLKAYITKFFRLWSRNQWKRERLAPSFHFDDFNIDPRSWMRFPILSSGFEKELKELDQL